MIFLRDNTLLTRDLRHEDVKPRLLGMHVPPVSVLGLC
jgi:phosphoketolase